MTSRKFAQGGKPSSTSSESLDSSFVPVAALEGFANTLKQVSSGITDKIEKIRLLLVSAATKGMVLSDVFPEGGAGEFLVGGKAGDTLSASQGEIMRTCEKLEVAIRKALD